MKKSVLPILALLVLGGSCVYFGVQIFASHRIASEGIVNKQSSCRVGQRAHLVLSIKNDQMQPATVNAQRCDILTIVNYDDKQRLIAFGEHENHLSYDGVGEKILNQNQAFSVTLVTAGSYIVHDHFQDSVQARFIVSD